MNYYHNIIYSSDSFRPQEAAFVEPIPTNAAQMENASRMPKSGGTTVYPKFTAQLEQDVTLVAFEMTKETALGKNSQGVNINAGYFFCLQERPGEMRFGLSNQNIEFPNSWNELNWFNFQNTEILKSTILLPSINESQGLLWFNSASDQCSILNRRPVLYSLHSKSLL